MQLEIKSNVAAHLMLLKTSTFKDPLCFVDEIIQNAERAGAKNIKFSFHTIEGNSWLIAENDGEVLNDFPKLFHIAESGWKSETVKAENPFGMGFFSIVPIASRCVIVSGEQKADWDITKALTGRLTVESAEAQIPVAGLELQIQLVPTISKYDITSRIRTIGSLCKVNVFLNGSPIKKEALYEVTGELEEILIQSPEINGRLEFKEYSFYTDVEVYYKGRFVCKLDTLPYFKGILQVESGLLNFTMPDRKDIVRDTKFDTFIGTITHFITAHLVSNLHKFNTHTRAQYDGVLQQYVESVKDIYIALPVISLDNLSDIAEYKNPEVHNKFKSLLSYINNRLKNEKERLSTQKINAQGPIISAEDPVITSTVKKLEAPTIYSTPKSGSGSSSGSVFASGSNTEAIASLPTESIPEIGSSPLKLYVTDRQLRNRETSDIVEQLLQMGVPIAITTTEFEARYAVAHEYTNVAGLQISVQSEVTISDVMSRAGAVITEALKQILPPELPISCMVGNAAVTKNMAVDSLELACKVSNPVAHWVYTARTVSTHTDPTVVINPQVLVGLKELNRSKAADVLSAKAFVFLYANRHLIDKIADAIKSS